MMDQDRNLGVTEARFGLTLLICLLGAIGFLVLMRLGGTSDLTVESGPAVEIDQGITRDETTPLKDEQQPQVLPIEPQQVSPIPHTSQRPERPNSGHRDESRALPVYPVLPAGSTDSPSTEPQLR